MPGVIKIAYCVKCKWMLRAAWLAQELLSTFERDEVISEVALVPSLAVSGVFEVTCDGETVWSRKVEGRFPEAKELKQRVRDVLAPSKDLGHSDVKAPSDKQEPGSEKVESSSGGYAET
eukprot:TRINITY_DN52060_c0_g1_i1.p1 TRINITY_DN52060_c0_g1~~TRINITY_DN52060_c0_g1_i1.p1  ORF type:complete len:119 (-),score=22.50 TRINITY_DN52060_c0_g1_i1:115-471(-)